MSMSLPTVLSKHSYNESVFVPQKKKIFIELLTRPLAHNYWNTTLVTMITVQKMMVQMKIMVKAVMAGTVAVVLVVLVMRWMVQVVVAMQTTWSQIDDDDTADDDTADDEVRKTVMKRRGYLGPWLACGQPWSPLCRPLSAPDLVLCSPPLYKHTSTYSYTYILINKNTHISTHILRLTSTFHASTNTSISTSTYIHSHTHTHT